jgi:hypothetical protein
MSQAEAPAAQALPASQAAALEKALRRYRSDSGEPVLADIEIVALPSSFWWLCIEGCISRARQITWRWARYLSPASRAGQIYAVVSAICCAVAVIAWVGSARSLASVSTGAAGCEAALSSVTHQNAAAENRRARFLFAHSQWPDLRAAGTAYVDFVAQVTATPSTDGYEAVWFTQRLSAACARHGRDA